MLRGCAAGGVMVRPLKEEQGEDEKVDRWRFLFAPFFLHLGGLVIMT